jgi:penicillin-binding protein-related factor A (putative recombinase)
MAVKVSEKTIERQIIMYLWSRRILCTKIDSTGIYDLKIGRFRKQFGQFKRLGVSDIIGIYKGRFLSIEVKSKDGRLSKDQKRWLSDVEAHGGIAIVARSVEDVEKVLGVQALGV